MSDVGKPSGLTRRKDNPNWYFRKRWPKAYQREGTPAEVWISLGTSLYSDALLHVDEARAEANKRFRAVPVEIIPVGIQPSFVRRRWPADPALPALKQDRCISLAQDYFQWAMRGLDAEPTRRDHEPRNGLQQYQEVLEPDQLGAPELRPETSPDLACCIGSCSSRISIGKEPVY